MKARALAVLIVLMLGIAASASWPASAFAQTICNVPAADALDEAQALLRRNNPDNLNIAVACLVLAAADTKKQLADLREGRIPFTGQVYAPGGFAVSRPPVQEGR